MPPQTPTYLPDRLAQTPFLGADGRVNREWLRHLRDTAQMTRQVLTLLGEIQTDVPVVGREEGLGTTLQNVDAAGTILAPGVDLARAYANKDQDHIPDGSEFGRVQNAALTANQVDLSKAGVIGPLGSHKVASNVTSNFTEQRDRRLHRQRSECHHSSLWPWGSGHQLAPAARGNYRPGTSRIFRDSSLRNVLLHHV